MLHYYVAAAVVTARCLKAQLQYFESWVEVVFCQTTISKVKKDLFNAFRGPKIAMDLIIAATKLTRQQNAITMTWQKWKH